MCDKCISALLKTYLKFFPLSNFIAEPAAVLLFYHHISGSTNYERVTSSIIIMLNASTPKVALFV